MYKDNILLAGEVGSEVNWQNELVKWLKKQPNKQIVNEGNFTPPVGNNNNPPQPKQDKDQPNDKQVGNIDLTQIQTYFNANKIKAIVKQPNGDLLVKFEGNNTQEQIINENDNTMDNEQKNMWKKFKEWMKSKNKTSLDKKELASIINKEQQPTKPKPTNYTPLIVGGIILTLLVIVGIVVIRKKHGKK